MRPVVQPWHRPELEKSKNPSAINQIFINEVLLSVFMVVYTVTAIALFRVS